MHTTDDIPDQYKPATPQPVNSSAETRSVLGEMQAAIHSTALSKGWWEDHEKLKQLLVDHGKEYDLDPALADTLFILSRTMLVVTELSEGVEAYRDGNKEDDKLPHFDGLSVELADAHIRMHDLAERFSLRVSDALVEKTEYNKSRSYKHGGKNI